MTVLSVLIFKGEETNVLELHREVLAHEFSRSKIPLVCIAPDFEETRRVWEECVKNGRISCLPENHHRTSLVIRSQLLL